MGVIGFKDNKLLFWYSQLIYDRWNYITDHLTLPSFHLCQLMWPEDLMLQAAATDELLCMMPSYFHHTRLLWSQTGWLVDSLVVSRLYSKGESVKLIIRFNISKHQMKVACNSFRIKYTPFFVYIYNCNIYFLKNKYLTKLYNSGYNYNRTINRHIPSIYLYIFLN